MMFMRLFLPLLALVISPLLITASKEKSWTLYHAWKGHDFSKRGKVYLRLGDDKTPTLTIDNTQEIQQLPLDDFYQLKLVEDGTKNVYTLTSVAACQVHRANFRDEITLTLNYRASVVSMAYIPLVSPLAPSCSELNPLNEKKSFTSKISMETATPGMVLPAVLPQSKPPPGLKFLKSKNGNKSNPLEQQEQEQTPQGFLRKYWYIILPLVIMSMTSGAAPEEQPQQAPHPSQTAAGASGGTTSTTAATAAPTASPSPSGRGAQRRRGKRG